MTLGERHVEMPLGDAQLVQQIRRPDGPCGLCGFFRRRRLGRRWLDDFADREQRRKLALERLRREIEIGLEDIREGRVGPLDMKQIKAEARKELSARRLKRVG
jgi:hypothetical protein